MNMNPRYDNIKSIQSSRLQSKLDKQGICASEVREATLMVVDEILSLQRPKKAEYSKANILEVCLYAAATKTSIEHAAGNLKNAPSSNTVRLNLRPLDFIKLEAELNEALVRVRPMPKKFLEAPMEVAVDLKEVAYYGKLDNLTPQQRDLIWTSKAKAGTNRFFMYASIYAIKNGKRFTFAVRLARKSEGVLGALKILLVRFHKLGGKIKCLYVDRGFFRVDVIRYLKCEAEINIPFCLAAIKTGKKNKNGIAALIQKKGVGLHKHTLRSPKYGELEIEVQVVGRYFGGRWDKHGKERLVFVLHDFPYPCQDAFQRYRKRFGIESSHRIFNIAKATTTSLCFNIRLLLVYLAIILYNLWVYLKWSCVSIPRRGGRLILHRSFNFRRMLSFLEEALEDIYGIVKEVVVVT